MGEDISGWTFFFYVTEWAIRLFMLGVVTSKHRPTGAMAWLLIIFFAPWFGLILYLLVAEHRLPRRRIEQHSRFQESVSRIREKYADDNDVTHPELGPQMEQTIRLARKLGRMPILGGNSAELMTDARDTIERMIEDIDRAEHHVHALFYIYSDDETGRKFSDALARAVQRGVQCRVLADAVGSWGMLKRLAPRMREEGIEVHPSLPVNPLRRRMERVDLRNHRKILIVDNRIGYTGSQNIVNPDYGRRNLVWKDLMARVQGPAVRQLQVLFWEDWYFDTNQIINDEEIFLPVQSRGDLAVQTLPSGPTYPMTNYQRLVVHSLYSAEKHVRITTPYFVPDSASLQALEMAAHRGVEVELVVPQRFDQRLVGLATRSYYEGLMEAGIRIFLYQRELIHSKTITVDDKLSFMGTSNFDIRSFSLNFEVNLLFYGQEMARKLSQVQSRYLEESLPLDKEEWKSRPLPKKIVQNTAKLLSPLL
jgi:cardiolipin synthase A/B